MDRVLQRRDTAANWSSTNPILAEGEIGIITDGAKGYKIGDGITRWDALEYPANPTSVVGELGDSEVAVINQNKVTTEFNKVSTIIPIYFDGFVTAVSVLEEKYSQQDGSVKYNNSTNRFIYYANDNYYNDWQDSNLYGTPYSYGMTPYINKIYVYKNEQYYAVSNNILVKSPSVIQTPNILNSNDYIYNIYYDSTGKEIGEPSRLSTDFISVNNGQIIDYVITGYSSSLSIAAFDSNKNIIAEKCISTSSLIGESGRIEVDSEIKYLRFTRLNNDHGLLQTVTFYNPDYLPLIDKSFEGIVNITNKDFTITGTYINPLGKEVTNANWNATPYISVSEGMKVYYRNLNGTSGGAIIASYDETKKLIEVVLGNSSNDGRIYKLPSRTQYVRFSYISTGVPASIKIISDTSKAILNSVAKVNNIVSGFDEFYVSGTWSRQDKDLIVTGGGFTSARAYTETFEDEFTISCNIKVTSANSSGNFEAGLGKSQTSMNHVGAWVTLCKNSTGSYLKLYHYVDGSYTEWVNARQSIVEGLTINKWYNLQFTKTTNNASSLIGKLYDVNSGNLLATFEISPAGTYAWGYPVVTNITGQSRFSNFIMYYPKNINPFISIYGDSFIEGDTIRTTKNLRYSSLLQSEFDKKDCLIYGHGGATAQSDCSRTLFQIEKLSSAYAIIAYGDNDSTYELWSEYITQLLYMCNLCDTIPIFVTVCPRVDQDKAYITKMTNINNWIKNSGYNYIDANTACTTDGLTWKDGYVLEDGVHPSIIGHEAIFNRIKIDCPFLLNN